MRAGRAAGGFSQSRSCRGESGSDVIPRGDADHAIAAFEHALSLNPNSSEAHAELARAKIDAGRAHAGIADSERAIRLSPTDPLIYLRYFMPGMVAVHMADDQTAVKWLLKARQAAILSSFCAMARGGIPRAWRGGEGEGYDGRVSERSCELHDRGVEEVSRHEQSGCC